VILGSKSRETHGHILLSHLRIPQPGGPGPRIYIPQEQGGPVIPPGTGFPFIVSYDLQGYGGGILTRLFTTLPGTEYCALMSGHWHGKRSQCLFQQNHHLLQSATYQKRGRCSCCVFHTDSHVETYFSPRVWECMQYVLGIREPCFFSLLSINLFLVCLF
jgi:hypothetical protein